MDGWGEEQPLIKGEKGPAATELAATAPAAPADAEEAPVHAIEDNSPDEAVTIPPREKAVSPTRPANTEARVNNNTLRNTQGTSTTRSTSTSTAPASTTPQRPRITYNGPGSGTGNNANEDNGFTSQGNTPGARGDAGSPDGHPDSYGNNPGGRVGGPKVISGNRKIIRYYSFTGDLPKATIYAQIKVASSGTGSFQRIVKPSTSFSSAYADAIKNYLRSIQFDKGSGDETVVVQFNFTVN